MELSEEDVLKILRLIDQSDFDLLQLEMGDMRLSVSRNGVVPTGEERAGSPRSDRASATVTTADAEAASAPAQARSPTRTAEPPNALAATLPDLEEGLRAITAPLLGTFYRASEPGAPPYVEIGVRVGPNDTVGLIEVMKVFTAVPAGVEGEIVDVCVENGRLVEYGETLFLVRPDSTSQAS